MTIIPFPKAKLKPKIAMPEPAWQGPGATNFDKTAQRIPPREYLLEAMSYDGIEAVWRNDRPWSHFRGLPLSWFNTYVATMAGRRVVGRMQTHGFYQIAFDNGPNLFLVQRVLWKIIYDSDPGPNVAITFRDNDPMNHSKENLITLRAKKKLASQV